MLYMCIWRINRIGEVMTLEEALSRPTISVPDAGAVFFALKRNASYDAAKKGDIPTVDVGGRKLAIVSAIAAKLGLATNFGGSGAKEARG
ncbi:hypothetical protein EON80_30255 [bacterium]|nr:MAG: hypothetical protein EON80_30255 [bacterium]